MKIYTLEIFNKYGVNCNWGTILVGIQNSLLATPLISNFAIEYLECHPGMDDTELVELAWSHNEPAEVEKLVINLIQNNWDRLKFDTAIELRKWRFCILKLLSEKSKGNSELLSKVEEVYADFHYPDEMKHLIRYMPPAPSDEYRPELHFKEDNEAQLIKKLKAFLESELEYLT